MHVTFVTDQIATTMKVTFILLLLVWSIESKVPISTGNECEWGVSYWCQSHDTAIRCGQLEYCQSIWKDDSLKEESTKLHSIECTACDIIVRLLKVWINENSTEAEVKSATLSLCDAVAPIKSECHTIVNDYFSDLWNGLKNGINTTELCGDILSCSTSSAITNMQHHSVNPVGNVIKDLECKICKAVVGHFYDPDAIEQKLESKLDTFCSLMPKSDEKKECTDAIKIVLDTLKSDADKLITSDSICTKMGYCDAIDEVLGSVSLKILPTGDSYCDLCKFVVSFLKSYIDSDTTEKEVQEVLKSICSLFPKNTQNECTDLVAEYFDIIWVLITSEFDNDAICDTLRLCNQIATKEVQLKSVKQNSCDICKLAVAFLKPYVDSNSTKSEAKDLLENVCTLLPSEISQQCTTFVDENFNRIWTLIENEVDSGEVCQILHLCNDTKVMIRRPIKGVILCAACELMMEELDNLLESNKTESAVINSMKKACGVLPAEYSEECKNITREYGTTIYELIIKGVSSRLICRMIGVCTGDPTAITTTDSASCNDCQEALKLIKLILPMESHNIVEGMKSFCNSLPYAITGECDTLVEEYGKEFVNDFVNYIDPLQICKDLDFCSSVTKSSLGTQRITCRSCNDDIKEFENLFSTKSHYFMNMMISSCKNIPEEITCSTIIKTHGRTIYQKIHSTLMNHRDACQHVCGASHSKKGHPRLAFNAAFKNHL